MKIADRFIIVETDNYNNDYPDEKRVNLPTMKKEQAKEITNLINKYCCSSRFWKVEERDYQLIPGFTP